MDDRLLDWYRGSGRDDAGRSLAKVLAHDDDWLEHTHDYIQWLFPLDEPSGVAPRAPLVSEHTKAAFAADPVLRARLADSLARMLAFYGLERRDGRIARSPAWAARRANWFLRDTHNNLRITRILKSLGLLGLPGEARVLLAALEGLCDTEPDCGIGPVSRRYWREAIRRSPRGARDG